MATVLLMLLVGACAGLGPILRLFLGRLWQYLPGRDRPPERDRPGSGSARDESAEFAEAWLAEALLHGSVDRAYYRKSMEELAAADAGHAIVIPPELR